MMVRFAAATEVASDVSLTPVEAARRDRLVQRVDREAFDAAHRLVRVCAGELLAIDPGEVDLEQRCGTCGRGGHGRPRVRGHPEVFVSLSHTRGQVAAVASDRPCGIDVEWRAASIPRGAVTAGERSWLDRRPDPSTDFTRLWVRKEALVKCGLALHPGDLEVVDESGLADSVAGLELTEWQCADGTVLGCVALAHQAVWEPP